MVGGLHGEYEEETQLSYESLCIYPLLKTGNCLSIQILRRSLVVKSEGVVIYRMLRRSIMWSELRYCHILHLKTRMPNPYSLISLKY